MNVLFICDEYPPGRNGGIGSAIQTLSRELVKQGHSVFVAGLYSYRYKQKNYEEDQGVKVWRMRYGINLPVSSENKLQKVLERMPRILQRNLNGKTAFRKYIDFVNTLIVSEKIDVIEIADFNNFAMYIGFVVEWPEFNIPLVLKSHGSYTYFSKEMGTPTNYNYEQADRLLYRRADALSAVSNYTAAIDKEIFNIQSNIQTLYNGVTMPAISVSERKKQSVVFTGTLVYKKGIYSLMKAWNTVHKKYPNAELIVLGKGSKNKLVALLDEAAKPSVKFMGHVNRDTLNKHLSEATLAIFPSYSETFGMGVVEAMSSHCPVIYTKKTCGPEIVKNNEQGLLVDPDNINEIAECIGTLIADPELGKRLAKNAFESVQQRFDIKVTAKQNLLFYEEAIKNFKQKPS